MAKKVLGVLKRGKVKAPNVLPEGPVLTPDVTFGDVAAINQKRGMSRRSAGHFAEEAMAAGIHPESIFFRKVCGMLFATDPMQRAFTVLSKEDPFNQVSMDTLVTWHEQDRWSALREHAVAKYQDFLLDKLGGRAISDRIELLSSTRDLRFRILKHLQTSDHPWEALFPDTKSEVCKVCGRLRYGHDDPLQTISPEKLLQHFVKVAELERSVGDIALAVMAQGSSFGKDGGPVTLTQDQNDGSHAVMKMLDKADDASIRAAAHDLIRMQKKRLSAKLEKPVQGGHTDDDAL
jgi:hypothetical protein